MIEYITDVRQEGKTIFILKTNDKSVTVDFKPEKPYIHDTSRIQPAEYEIGGIIVYGDFTVYASKVHLAEILLAIELVKVIKENN